MKVLKFGGSSVKSAERIQQVSSILKSYHESGEQFVVVFSAFGGVTDLLLARNGRKLGIDAGPVMKRRRDGGRT